MAPRPDRCWGLHELSGTPQREHRVARISRQMPSDVEAFFGLPFTGGHAIVDALSVLAFLGAHGFVAIPAGFTANLFLAHDFGLNRWMVCRTSSITELSLSLLIPMSSEAAVKTIQNQGSCRKCRLI